MYIYVNIQIKVEGETFPIPQLQSEMESMVILLSKRLIGALLLQQT